MTGVPTWQGATSGQPPLAGHINQLLGTHPATVLYAATQTAAQSTAGATSTNTNGTWLAQSFTTAVGQTAIGHIIVPIRTATTNAALLAPTTVSLYANSGGAPTGSPLVSTTITVEYATTAVLNSPVIYPLPITGLTASTTYWLVTPAAGGSSDHYNWYRSNQVSGASTSTNGTTWTAQAYGFQYRIFDQSALGLVTSTWEDSGVRWTATTYNATEQVATYAEYTSGQTATGYTQSNRTYTYSSGVLTSIA